MIYFKVETVRGSNQKQKDVRLLGMADQHGLGRLLNDLTYKAVVVSRVNPGEFEAYKKSAGTLPVYETRF